MTNITKALFAAAVALGLLAGCSTGEITLKDYENIKPGTSIEAVHERFGEPEAGLFGMFGEIYTFEDKSIVIYYADDGSGDAKVSSVRISELEEEPLQL